MSVINKSIDIHLLTNCNGYFDKYFNFIEICAKAGITHVQCRQKTWQFKKLLDFCKELKSILTPYKIPLIINDNIKLAIKINADGIHVGQSDTPINDVRKIFGGQKILGLSIETIEELNIANQLTSLDYVAASAVFPSNTKHDLKKIWGLNGLRQFCKISKHPVIAIGGINCDNIRQVVATGISGIAIISAIHDAANPKNYIQQLIQLISGNDNESV